MIKYLVYDAEYDRDHAGHALYQAAERYDPEGIERIREHDPRVDMRWPLKRPVVISWMTIEEDGGRLVPGQLRSIGQPELSEADMLAQFFAAVSALPASVPLVTWGGSSSDEPQLRLAGMRLGLALPSRLLVPFQAGRRHGPHHVDLLSHLCGDAARVHLAEVCAALRVPAKVVAAPTATAGLIAQRKWSQVKGICENDVLSAAAVLLHAAAPRTSTDTLFGMLIRLARFGAGQQHRPYAEAFAAWGQELERAETNRLLDQLALEVADEATEAA